MIHILIAEDEKPISNLIKLSLKNAGYSCDCAFDGGEAADMIEENNYDLILLDIMLPDIDGFELMEYIRPLEIPVIFITAKNSVQDKVKGLRMGAEDYIVKPFEIIELLARIDVVLRRYHKADDIIKIAGLMIDTKSRKVTRGGIEIALTPKEYELLLLFAQNPNTALYRETIYERIWEKEFVYGSKAVDLHIQRLRRKAHLEKELQAVNKVGYRFEVDT
ncbi:MAG: response regulator transcription factor [Eubacterium sp.]|nr:response regulator transcription factor [Eubacterium sp.]MCI8917741.1 response regulator transcription factor [Eubacterium sp.]